METSSALSSPTESTTGMGTRWLRRTSPSPSTPALLVAAPYAGLQMPGLGRLSELMAQVSRPGTAQKMTRTSVTGADWYRASREWMWLAC